MSASTKYSPLVLRILEELHEPFSNEERAQIIERGLLDAQIDILQKVALELEEG